MLEKTNPKWINSLNMLVREVEKDTIFSLWLRKIQAGPYWDTLKNKLFHDRYLEKKA